MKLSFEFNERHFLVLVMVLAMVSAVGIVMGYGTSDPLTLGHTAGELDPGTFPGGGDYVFPTDTKVSFGDGGQVSMYYNGTDFIIEG